MLVRDREEEKREGESGSRAGTRGGTIGKYEGSVSLVGVSPWISGRAQEEGGVTVGWGNSWTLAASNRGNFKVEGSSILCGMSLRELTITCIPNPLDQVLSGAKLCRLLWQSFFKVGGALVSPPYLYQEHPAPRRNSVKHQSASGLPFSSLQLERVCEVWG